MLAATALYGFNWPLDGGRAATEPAVRLYLQMEQARAASAQFPDGSTPGNREQLEALAAANEAGRHVTISALDVRGSLMRAVARVEFDVDGAAPPDGRRVRYLRLHQTIGSGWMVDRSTTRLQYYFLF